MLRKMREIESNMTETVHSLDCANRYFVWITDETAYQTFETQIYGKNFQFRTIVCIVVKIDLLVVSDCQKLSYTVILG